MCENVEYKLVCYDSLRELYVLYDKVRQAVILGENFDPERKMYIAPINQLRSALDHIFKAINCAKDQEQSAYELKEAKEHLDRAGYDALELLAGNLGTMVIEKVSKYGNQALVAVFPDYFKEIKPKIIDIKKNVAILRSEKKIDSEKSFSTYFDQIVELIEFNKRVDVMIPSLEEFEQKDKKSKKQGRMVHFVLSIVSGLVVGFVVYWLAR